MKRKLCSIGYGSIFFLCLIMLLVFVPVQASAATKLNYDHVTLCRYHSVRLNLKNHSGKIKWSSQDKNVATVTQRGTVTAVSAGTTTIKAKAGKKVYQCKVTVKEYNTETQYAAYGYYALTKQMSSMKDLKIKQVYQGSFISNIPFACFECSFKDKSGNTKNAWIYVYEQELPSSSCYTLNTEFYTNNLILKFENLGMDSVLSLRCSPMKLSDVKNASNYIFAYEKASVEKGENFDLANSWLKL